MVAERRSDVVQVVVLAAHAHHLLRRGRARVLALLAPQKQVLELIHPGVGEEQRRVVRRHEGRAGHHAVAVLLEVFQERRPDLVRRHRFILYGVTRSAALRDRGSRHSDGRWAGPGDIPPLAMRQVVVSAPPAPRSDPRSARSARRRRSTKGGRHGAVLIRAAFAQPALS